MSWTKRGMGRALGVVLLILVSLRLQGQVATTTIADTIYRADGTLATGTVIVSWPAFTTAAGQAVPGGSTSAPIATGGVFSMKLAANAGATPAGTFYTAVYHLDNGSVSREYWVVPVSQAAVTVSSVRSTVLPASMRCRRQARAMWIRRLRQR
jgi:C4-dicarboxylate transporter